MAEWIFVCNPKFYNIDEAYNSGSSIDWASQNTEIHTGDIVYIYVCTPIKQIKYKCLVNEPDLSVATRGIEYCINGERYCNRVGPYTNISFIERFPDNLFPLKEMEGMFTYRKRCSKCSPELSAYFNEKLQEVR